MSKFATTLVHVFPAAPGGGNPAPIVLEADAMSAEEMREVARSYGHESGFVLAPEAGSGAQFRMRYFVPEHEMEMCGHATVGALWLLRRHGRWTTDATVVQTPSGPVRGYVRNVGTATEYVEITQPAGRLEEVRDVALLTRIAAALGIAPEAMSTYPVYNAATSRVKTLIALDSVERLNTLTPDYGAMRQLCEALDSTGLYPFAVESKQERVFHARQFPKSSGYPEDAATGIAAAALLFGLRAYGLVPLDGQAVTVRQGYAMGKPSEIRLRFELDGSGAAIGCFVGGRVTD